MSLRIGRLGWVGVGFESTYGSPVAVTDYLPFTENSLAGKQEQISNTASYGIRDREIGSTLGKKNSEGNISMNLDAKLSGYLFGGALGTINSANVAGSVYDHTMTRNNTNTPKSLTVINDRGVDRESFAGVAVNTLELDVADGMATVKSGLMGHFPITTASGTLTTASGGLFSFKDAFFAFGTSVGAAANNSNLKPHDFKLTLNNNSQGVWRHGSADVDVVNQGEFTVTGEMTVYFEGTNERDLYYNNAKNAGVFKLTGQGIGGGYNESVTVDLYQLRTDDWSLETGLANFYAEKIKFAMEYDFGNSKTIDAVFRNTKTSY